MHPAFFVTFNSVPTLTLEQHGTKAWDRIFVQN